MSESTSRSSEYSSSKTSDFEQETTTDAEIDKTFQIINEDSVRIHELLGHEDIEKLYEVFKNSRYQKFDAAELRGILEEFNIFYTDKEFNVLFLKVWDPVFNPIFRSQKKISVKHKSRSTL